MKGIKADAKSKKVEYLEDGLTMPLYSPPPEPIGVDLTILKTMLEDLQARIEKLEKIK